MLTNPSQADQRWCGISGGTSSPYGLHLFSSQKSSESRPFFNPLQRVVGNGVDTLDLRQ